MGLVSAPVTNAGVITAGKAEGAFKSSRAQVDLVAVYLTVLVPPVLECFDDLESRVVFYAAEAMYNMARVSRTHILPFFSQLFEGLCKLFAHVDVDVKNGKCPCSFCPAFALLILSV